MKLVVLAILVVLIIDLISYYSSLKALNKTSRVVRYFPSLRAVVNQSRPLVYTSASLSTSSADKATVVDGQGKENSQKLLSVLKICRKIET